MSSIEDLLKRISTAKYGYRRGTINEPKGEGYFGELPNKTRGGVSTELSIDSPILGIPMQHPSITPNLSLDQLARIFNWHPPLKEPDDAYEAADKFAEYRFLSGQPLFKANDEQTAPIDIQALIKLLKR